MKLQQIDATGSPIDLSLTFRRHSICARPSNYVSVSRARNEYHPFGLLPRCNTIPRVGNPANAGPSIVNP